MSEQLSQPLLKDIDGLYKFLDQLEAHYKQYNSTDVIRFIRDLWTCTPASKVPAPHWLSINDSNAIASIVLAYRQDQLNKGKPVEIKKVAEIRGSRFNTGKLRMDLIDPLAMQGLAAVLTKGAEKYTANNWRDGLPYTETVASLLRHTFAFLRGEDIDPETGESHVDHMQCNTMFLSNMTKTRPDMDDRWKPPVPVSGAGAEIDWQAAAKKAFPDGGKSS